MGVRTVEVRLNMFLEEAAENERSGKSVIGSAERNQAVGVNLFEEDWKFFRGSGDHPWKEKTRKFVGYDYRGAGSESIEQPFAGVFVRFQIRIVNGVRIFAAEPARVGSHAGGHEVAETVRGPGKIEAKWLEDQQGLSEFAAPLDSAVERKVVVSAAGGDHPVEDVVAVGIDGRVVAGLDANWVEGHRPRYLDSLFAAGKRLFGAR
jgi:hypothetical protein